MSMASVALSTLVLSLVGAAIMLAKNADEKEKLQKLQQKYLVGNAGFTELMFSAKEGDSKACEHLLESGIDINQQDDKGATALIYATLSNSVSVARLLLSKGANPHIPTNKGLTVMAIAKNNNLNQLIELLRKSPMQK